MEKIYELETFNKYNGTNDYEYFNDKNELIEAINNEKETEFDLFKTEIDELMEYLKDDKLVKLRVLTDDERIEHLKDMFYLYNETNRKNDNFYSVFENLDEFVEYRKSNFIEYLAEEDDIDLITYNLDREKDYLREVDCLVSNSYPFVIEEVSGMNEYDNLIKLIELDDNTRISEVQSFLKGDY